MKRNWVWASALCFGICLGDAQSALSFGEWPQFLGPNRNGISSEKNLIEKFAATGPKIVWRFPAGVGKSGMAITGTSVLTTCQDESNQYALALDLKTGKQLWKTPIAPKYENQMGDGPRGTPTISDDRVFVYSGEGVLSAIDLKSGKLQWSSNPVSDLGSQVADYGMASSPLVVKDKVIVSVGGTESSLVAFDAKTGEASWKVASDPAGYSSPALLEVGGKQQVVAFQGSSVIGVTPDTGELLWSFPFETDYNCNIATPIAVDGNVFISAGENHGSVMLKLKPSGTGFEPEVVWESLGPRSLLRNEWQTSISIDGYLYGFDNVGGAGPVSHLTCLEAATGKRVWQAARFGKGNMIAADGKLYIVTIEGDLVIAKVSSEKYEEFSRAKVLEMTRQAPALSEGHLLVRDDNEIICIDLKK